ncbi:MAG: LysE family translocator [Pseudomonadota bacterium]
MTWASLLAFNLVLAAAIASPGAALLYFIKTCVASGKAAGIATGMGLGLAAAGWTLAALVGLESLFALFPWTYSILKTGGALYLLWIAWRTWRNAKSPLSNTAKPRGRAFLSGFAVNLGNPKSMLFAAAVILVVFPQGLAPQHIALIVANHFVLEVTFYAVFALALSSAPARRSYLGAKPILDRIVASLLGALGLRLLLEK